MANVETHLKRLAVRLAVRPPLNVSPLLDVLYGFATARWNAVKTGIVITSTSANGHTTTAELPADSGLSPSDAAAMGEELITRYEEAVEKLNADEESGEPTDQEIADEMLRCLKANRGWTSDFSTVREEPELVEEGEE